MTTRGMKERKVALCRVQLWLHSMKVVCHICRWMEMVFDFSRSEPFPAMGGLSVARISEFNEHLCLGRIRNRFYTAKANFKAIILSKLAYCVDEREAGKG
ncbi:Uncharacterized protein TCM_043472 [Theobroma cacao]|uniref:Uncharacterized protein n=1 Tax=Theobroma cacao TaxID=3641 RepID=A0A061FQK1_THECC|nr:Uncharacterized protein TCM_043472 [Theobroma cacao]